MPEPPSPPGPMTWRDRLELIARPPSLSPGQIAIVVVGAVVALLAVWFFLRQPVGPPAEASIPLAATSAAATTSTTAPKVVVVHAAGAVRVPGVYRLPTGARVTDLLEAAGGATTDAELDRLNLAALLVDGSQIYVPRMGEAVPSGVGTAGSEGSVPAGPLDLNTATLDQLDALPGVGPATAKAIIAERERRGGFRAVDELLDVRGIGPAKLEALRDLVTV